MPRQKTSESEKRSAGKERQKRYRSRQALIGNQMERWKEVKLKMGVECDADVAKTLIDWYLDGRSGEAVAGVRCQTQKLKPQQDKDLRNPSQQSIQTTEPEISLVTEDNDRSQGKRNTELEEELQLDCESVDDDDAVQQSNVVFGKSRKQAISRTTGKERILCTVGEATSNQEVEFQSIHGLPVDVPFTLQYLSPCAGKTLKSKMYIIVEQRLLTYKPVTPVSINVQGDICEHVSDSTSSFMKDINDQKMSSWVDIKNIIKKVVVSMQTSQMQRINELEKHDQSMKTGQINSASKVEKLYPTLKPRSSKNVNQTMDNGIGLIMDTDKTEKVGENTRITTLDEIKIGVSTGVSDSFGMSNVHVPGSFGLSNNRDRFDVSSKQDGFGVSNIPDSFDVSNVPDSFGVSNVPDSFDVSNVPDSFDVSNVPDSFDVSNVPDSFGVSNIPDSFGVSNVPDSFDVSNVPDSFGVSNVPDSFDVSNVPDSFDVSNVPDSFDVSNVPDSCGVSNVPDSFDVSNVPDSCGVSNVPDSFDVSNVPDSCGVSNVPMFIKQEGQDLEYELALESRNIGTNLENIRMTDLVRGILDGIIGNVVEKCHAKFNSVPKSNVNKVTPKRRIDDVSYNVYEKKKKFLKVEENSHACQAERQSSRLRSKGFRIDYGQLNDLNDFSDLDDIFPDSEGGDDSDGHDQRGTSAGIEIKRNSCGRKKKRNSVEKKKHKNLKRKEEDQDFNLSDFETENEKPNAHSVSMDDGNEDGNLDLNVDEDSEQKGVKCSSLISAEEKREIARQKYTEKQLLKRIEREMGRIKVKLCEHTDKYAVEEHVSFEMKDRGKKDTEKTIKMLVCTFCKNFRTENEEQMEKHIEQHLNGDLTCKECNFHASNFGEMNIHNKNHRKVPIRTHQCPICGLKCENDKNYKDHLLSLHNLYRFVCEVCLKAGKQVSFNSRVKKQQHFLEHHKDCMFHCSDCKRYFRKSGSLTVHLCSPNTLDASNAPCEICGKVMRKDSIPFHKQTVHFNIRKNKCPHCSYAAKLPWQVKKHIEARHEGVHSYQCDQCTFSCVRPYQLVCHQRTHTGHKPYKCDECPYSAAFNVQLKDHKKLHNNPLGVECKICGVVVRLGPAYNKHMKKEHSDVSADDL